MDPPSLLLGPDGPFSRHIPGFAPRRQQQEMAETIAQTLDARSLLIAEAGTGTGKTFAYLVPALLCGQKVVVSTGTRNLQDQLFHKDLPVVRQALGVPIDVALMKGRANYLCLHRLERAQSHGRFRSRVEIAALRRIEQWAGRTVSGDVAEAAGVAEDDPIWPWVTSTADNCLGQECERYADCFLTKARRRAQEADLVVVNHHLLFADIALREEGFGELLPDANAFIIDEAHQLPEVASSFFGVSATGNQLLELARDVIAEDRKWAGELRDLEQAAAALEKATHDLRLAFGAAVRRAAWPSVAHKTEVVEGVTGALSALEALGRRLEPQAQRSKGMESCLRRCGELHGRLAQVTGESPDDHVHWFETHRRSFTITLTPLDIAPIFRQQLTSRPRAWVFTSATLAVGDRFEHFSEALGLEQARTGRWESPFDFGRQALLYLPTGLPDPAAPHYTAAVVEQAVPVIEASGGRAFLLFTSHRALREAAERLPQRIAFPLLVQGEAPRGRLLQRFREAGNAVLLGTSSFWEGVDVRGEALSCVIIDKLPFASPGDPIQQARIDALRRSGGNPFSEYQLPQAIIALKQGAGRLIRDVDDRGVLMICDPRLCGRGYGKVFLDSLPPMRITRDREEVLRFFG